MNKISQQKMMLSAFLLTLLFLSIYACPLPSAQATELTTQQKGLALSSNVLGFDTTKCNITTKEYPRVSEMSYLGVVPQDSIEYTLTSDTSRARLFYTFANGKLQLLEVLENEATQSVAKPRTSDIFAAKSFLTRYQSYTSDVFYSQLSALMNQVDYNKNTTVTSKNLALQVNTTVDSTTFKWYYTSNGVIAPYSKFITIVVNNGCVTAFVDNWSLYPVENTSVNISREKAIDIGLEAAKNHSWSLKLDSSSLEPKNFNDSNVRWTALLFDGSLNADNARNKNPLTLYPVWRVGIALDKWYGSLYGVQVDIWADTGEVRAVHEAWSTSDPPEGVPIAHLANQEPVTIHLNTNMTMLIAISGSFAIGLLVYLGSNKKLQYQSLLKERRIFKAGSILLCILIASTVMLGSLETASATRGAVVWGSESTGAGTFPDSWRKHDIEILYQRNAAGNLSQFFGAGGYTGNNGINHQGINNPGSSKNQILMDISALQNYNDYFAVVDFDHGVGRPDYAPAPPGEFHYMFEDNRGTYYNNDWHADGGVYDMDIYPLVDPNKLIFAFISTCMSADLSYGQGYLDPQWPPYTGRALGMPYAWTHRYVTDKSATPGFSINQQISNDGFSDPDWGRQVYIGFIGGSASLEQGLPLNGNPYFYWVCSFIGHAMYNDQSVNEAMNTASLQFLGSEFLGSALHTGFTPYWWRMDGMFPPSTLAIYGNGSIHLNYYTPPSDTATAQYVSGPTTGDAYVSYDFSGFATDPYGHNIQYRFDWGDNSPYTETGWYSDGAIASASHSWSSGGYWNVRVQTRCPNGDWSAWSQPLVMNIGQPVYHWLTVEVIDSQTGYPLYPEIYIDGNYAGNGYVSMQVLEGYHSVSVSDPTWNGYLMCWGYLWFFDDYGGNGDYRAVYSDRYVEAIYS